MVVAPKGMGLGVDAHNMKVKPPVVVGNEERFVHEERQVPPYLPEPDAPPSVNESLPFVTVGAGATGNEGSLRRYSDETLEAGRITFKAVQAIVIGQDLVNVAAVRLGDALPGLAVTSGQDNTLYVLHNQGSLQFGNPESYPAANPVGVIAGAAITCQDVLVVVNSGSDSLSLYKPAG